MKTFFLILFLVATLPHNTSAQAPNRVEDLLQSMSLEQKIGQLFLVNVYGKQLDAGGAAYLAEMQPGGVALFGFNAAQDPAQLAQFIADIQQTAAVPLFVATDHEGGRVQRLASGFTPLPDPLFLGAPTQPQSLTRLGAAVGAELNAVGVNMVFAPVADLHTRSDFFNTVRVMHRRTWGDDPARVGGQTAAYSEGLAAAGVVGVVKHFPGHGGAGDSHAGLPRLEGDAQDALAAFRAALGGGVPAVMVGHLYYSQLEPQEGLPASLSPTMLGILRDDFGFEGVIMTDAMDMAAVANNFYTPDAALAFVLAGGDLFVTGPFMEWGTQRLAVQRLIAAVESGELSESRIDASVRRILTLKQAYGILDWQPTAVSIDLQATQDALTAVFMDAATLLRDDRALLPLRPAESIALVYHNLAPNLAASCAGYAPTATLHGYNFRPAAWEYGVVAQLGREHDKIVFFAEDIFFTEEQRDLLFVLPAEKTVLVAMNAPYDVEVAGGVSSVLTLYANTPASQSAACAVLFGQHPISGQLPIALRGYPTGSGIIE